MLIILVMARFAVVPLQNAARDKRTLLKEHEETYRMKALTVEKHKTDIRAAGVNAGGPGFDAANAVYRKEYAYTEIQADLLQRIITDAEKLKLNVLSFELPDVAVSGHLSEVSVVIRLQGDLKAVISLLKDIETGQKALKTKHFEISKTGQDVIFLLTIAAFRAEA